MKTGLVMEGGAMRGMFTAGVTDVLMENGIEFDGAIGTSAGAVFGCNYKSHQIGRSVRYNKKYCNDKRYVSLRSWLTTGDLYSAEFGYHQIPNELDPFDVQTFQSSPMEFYAVCTDAETGKAVYRKCEKCDEEDIQWLRASASMPLASRLVNINGRLYSDGGAADSVPLRYFQSIGYGRNVVILTQPLEYVKKKNSLMPIIKIALRKYPMLVEALKTRHVRYNEDIEYIKEQEKLGTVLAVRPPMPLKIGAVEHNPDELERVYQIGRATAEGRLDEIKQFINESGNIK